MLAIQTCQGEALKSLYEVKRWQFSTQQGNRKNLHAEVAKIYSKNESPLCEIAKKEEKKMFASFIVVDLFLCLI